MVNNTFRNHKNENSNHKTTEAHRRQLRCAGAFFNLRGSDLSELEKAGGAGTMNLVLEDTIRVIRYKLLGRENKNVRGTGKFRR